MGKNRRFVLPAAAALGVLAADQMIKHAVRQTPLCSELLCLPGVLEITHCVNTGAAFSVLEGRALLLAALSVLLLAGLIVFFMRSPELNTGTHVALGVLAGGGLGNLADRIVFGGVTDYIRLLFLPFPVFNLADICITCSILYLVFSLLTGRLDPFAKHE